MCAEHARIEPDAANPVADAPRMAARRAEQELARLYAAGPDIVIGRLPGLFGDFESYRPPGLLLAHRRPLNGVAERGNVLDLEGDNIATAQLAVDRHIEHRHVARAPRDLQLGADRPDVLWPQRRACSD